MARGKAAPTGKQLFELVAKLPNEERKAFWKIAFDTPAPGNLVIKFKGIIDKQSEAIQQSLEMMKSLSDEVQRLREKEERTKVKKRFAARNKEIVRLKDDDQLSFGEVKREIKKTKAWVTMENGREITVGAVKKAYYRELEARKIAALLVNYGRASPYGWASEEFLAYCQSDLSKQ